MGLPIIFGLCVSYFLSRAAASRDGAEMCRGTAFRFGRYRVDHGVDPTVRSAAPGTNNDTNEEK